MEPIASSQNAPSQDDAQGSAPKIIGRVSATANQPSSSEQFYFWLEPRVIVNPFDIVETDQVSAKGVSERSKTYGIVITLEHTTDAASHLSNFIANDFGDVSAVANTPRQGAVVARVAVLSNSEDIYMPAPNDSSVRFADAEGIYRALGIDLIPEHYRVPAGIIQMSNGTQAVVCIDRRYLLGPEGAHLNISGISGLATKTSYAMFLLQSILQTAPDREKIAVILLNVKHGDLLHIDEPDPDLSEEEKALWAAMGLEPKPFENVRYLLPWGKHSQRDGKPNSFTIPNANWTMYAYALQDTYDKLDLLLSQIPDPHDTISSLIGEIREGLGGSGRWQPSQKWANATTWHNLLNGEPLVKNGTAQAIGDVRSVSVGRFRRLLRRVVQTHQSGIFVEHRARSAANLSQEIAKIRGGEVVVVDIAKLTDDEQTLVFGDILRTIYALYAESDEEDIGETIPEKVIIFVDELNKYTPARESGSPIIEQVLDIAERGRSLGVVLFGAEQFRSAVHPRVVGNCATHAFGRTGSTELSDAAYRALDTDVRLSLTRLEKGELLLSHAIFRQPVKIRFPRPAYRQEGKG
ncbi:MAG: ATP-binding protein [Fimbriimonadales bacterium]|nr:ATP-binding protein [Fimbriimonadales bacterium]